MKKQIFILMLCMILLPAGHVKAMEDDIKFSDNFKVGTPAKISKTVPWLMSATKDFSLKKGQTLSFKHQLDITKGSIYWGLSQNGKEPIKISNSYGAPQYTGLRTSDVYVVEYLAPKDLTNVRLVLYSTHAFPEFTVMKFEVKIKNSKDEFKKK